MREVATTDKELIRKLKKELCGELDYFPPLTGYWKCGDTPCEECTVENNYEVDGCFDAMMMDLVVRAAPICGVDAE